MSKNKRSRYAAEFKAKVALEAIKGEQTSAELAAKYSLHPHMITNWKRQAIENLAETFATKASKPHPQHKICPYLLRGMTIDRPNQVWCADISYIPMRKGFLYLVAIMDWASRRVLSWRLSNTMDADFCVAALEEALDRYGKPEIFNTDQGSQFTGDDFTNTLQTVNIRISMDGKGRWMDNVMIERLWRSLKYECIYLHAFETGSEVRQGLKHWIDFYNTRRPHSSLDDKTPDEACWQKPRPGYAARDGDSLAFREGQGEALCR